MYYDDEDDDPYAPRTGPAAMPSPHSKFAPYYSGHANTFEDFLEEFEGRAYDCELMDLQRVDVIIRYVDLSLHELCRTLDGFRSRNWPLFRQSLVNVFGSTTPRHQVLRQKLHSYIQDSSRRRMFCEDDVLRYYRQFICFGLPLVHAGHLTEEDRNAAFWCGFHPEDRKVLQPRLLSKNPCQPPDIPFHFDDVFGCARAAFAYDGSSFWSHTKQFESPSFRREQPVVEPIPQDAYSFRAVRCAIASNAETTTTPDELSLFSHSTPDTQLPSSSSPSALESQNTQAPSVTLDQPEPAYTLSTTLLPSASPPSHIPSLVYLASDSDPIPASMPPSFSLTPLAFPTPTHPDSLARSDAEISSILPLSSIMPTSTMPSVSSGFQCLPSVTEEQAEPEPEPTPSIIPSSPALLSAPSLTLPIIDDDTELESAPLPLSSTTPTDLECPLSPVLTATDNLPEHEPMSSTASTSPVLPHTPSLAPSFTDDVPELFPTLPALQSASLARSEVRTSLSPPTRPSPPESPTSLPAHSLPSLRLSPGEPCCNFELEPFAAPANLAPPPSTFVLLPAFPASSDLPSASPSSSFVLSSGLESSTVNIAPRSSLESSWSSVYESVLLPASLDVSQNASISPRPLPLQRSRGLKTVDSDSFLLEITPPLASSVPRQSQELSRVYGTSPALALRPSLFYSSPSLRLFGTSARFGFTLALVTAAVLASILNISAIVSTFARKFQSKIEDFGNNQNGNLKTSNILAHRLRLGQLTPRAPRLVFDPGGQSSSF